jgi:hypothetical protein
MSEWTVVGVDCAATDPSRVGLALAVGSAEALAVVETTVGSRTKTPEAVVAGWIADAPRVLLALDAPLGWPVPLGDRLASHAAGEPLPGEANALFRRATDVDVAKRLGKRPLDVGADRIARTAHGALTLLERLRERTGRSIGLAWTPESGADVRAIEVYPAGTLKARGFRHTGYKLATHRAERSELIASLAHELGLPADVSLLEDNADVLDAALCVLAARDFLLGRAVPPADPGLAVREGWIWVADPPARGRDGR